MVLVEFIPVCLFLVAVKQQLKTMVQSVEMNQSGAELHHVNIHRPAIGIVKAICQ